MTLRCMTMVVAFALALPALGAAQTVQPLFGRKLLITDSTTPSKRKIVVKITGAFDASGTDLLADGAFLHVFNSAGTADSACMPLPAAGWNASGTGFRYADKASANGPCLVALLKPGKLFKAACKATHSQIDYTLNEPAQAAVGVRFLAADVVLCADFGGAGPKDVPGKRFSAKNAAAPLTCVTPPAACPAVN